MSESRTETLQSDATPSSTSTILSTLQMRRQGVALGIVLGAALFAGESIRRGMWSSAAVAQAPRTTGRNPFKTFGLDNAVIPRAEIRHGGPSVDGIPALTNPKFVGADQAGYLRPTDRVIGIVVDGTAKAYPLKILDYHEAVNDRIGDREFVATYCPLCDSSIIYNRRVGDEVLEFGVSGLLYNSNVLLYNRGNAGAMSLWSQLRAGSVAGPSVTTKLEMLPFELATWADWLSRYPATTVLSSDTGYPRNYALSPYAPYFAVPTLMFPVNHEDNRLAKKQPVLGIWKDETAIAFPYTDFRDITEAREITTTFDGAPLVLAFNPKGPSLRVVQAGEGVQWTYSLWFAWAAFHPDTTIFVRP